MSLDPQERSARISQALAERDDQTNRAWEHHDAVLRDHRARLDQVQAQADAELDQEIARISNVYAAKLEEIEAADRPARIADPKPAPGIAAAGEPAVSPAVAEELRELGELSRLVDKYLQGDSLLYDVHMQLLERSVDAQGHAADLAQIAADTQAEAEKDELVEYSVIEAEAGRYYCTLCHKVEVDPDQGFDTCPECAAKIEPELR